MEDRDMTVDEQIRETESEISRIEQELEDKREEFEELPADDESGNDAGAAGEEPEGEANGNDSYNEALNDDLEDIELSEQEKQLILDISRLEGELNAKQMKLMALKKRKNDESANDSEYFGGEGNAE